MIFQSLSTFPIRNTWRTGNLTHYFFVGEQFRVTQCKIRISRCYIRVSRKLEAKDYLRKNPHQNISFGLAVGKVKTKTKQKEKNKNLKVKLQHSQEQGGACETMELLVRLSSKVNTKLKWDENGKPQSIPSLFFIRNAFHRWNEFENGAVGPVTFPSQHKAKLKMK